MIITFYKNKAENNRLDKTSYLTKIMDVTNCDFKNDESIMTPTIILDNLDRNSLKNANYVYIELLERYYYINDIQMLLGNRISLELTEDVLMSNLTDIKNLTATADRNENKRNGYLVDSQYKTLAYEEIVTKGFPNAIDGYSTIIMTVG